MRNRPRRNRKSAALREFAAETALSADRFVWPVFIHEGDQDEAIDSMPGQSRLSPEGLLREVEGALGEGVRSIVLFPRVPDELKHSDGRAVRDAEGLVPRSIRELKSRFPELTIITDVALDPYSPDGHDGIVAPDGRILNDETVEVLCDQAVVQAEAGADVIAPSDMMDGRIGALRDALDARGFTEVSL
ncbi:MAG: porphobilinogen synthase, partial [Planctomycetota bacterium]